MPVEVCGTGVHGLALDWVQQGMSLACLHAAGCLVLLWYWISSTFLSLFFYSYVLKTVSLMLLELGRDLGMPEECAGEEHAFPPSAVWLGKAVQVSPRRFPRLRAAAEPKAQPKPH